MSDISFISHVPFLKRIPEFALSKREEKQERENQRIGRGIKQKESQDHGKKKSQITVMQG